MNKRLRAGCVSAALTLIMGVAAAPAHAEEGRELTLSDSTVTAGSTFTVSGDGCSREESDWIRILAGDTVLLAPTTGDGVWTADMPVDGHTFGVARVTAHCGIDATNWAYAPTMVNVVYGGNHGSESEPRLWLSHPTVTAGYVLHVYGLGCSSEVEVHIGGLTESATPVSGAWRVAPLIPDQTVGELSVSATCAGVDATVYPSTIVNVITEGNLGFPLIPETGGGDPAPPAPSTAVPSTPPGLPTTGW